MQPLQGYTRNTIWNQIRCFSNKNSNTLGLTQTGI